jgi:hypothetical protein
MNWADCETAWKRQQVPEASAAEVASLEAGFETERRKMARVRLVRCIVEGSMGPVVCIGIGLAWWITGKGGWPTLAAIGLILGGFAAVWLLGRRRSAQPGPGAPLLDKVEADISDMQAQRRRLLTMRTWHFGPVYATVLLVPFVWVLKSRVTSFPVAFAIYYAALMLLSWAHNRIEVRRRIDPRLDDLEKLRAALAARA